MIQFCRASCFLSRSFQFEFTVSEYHRDAGVINFCIVPSLRISEIAGKLFLSVKTVSTYRSRILQKMAMKSNADITYYAIKNGLLQ